MPHGPGKYDAQCVKALEDAGAREGALIVLDGTFGAGFSIQMTAHALLRLPSILRLMADDIELDNKEMQNAADRADKDHPVQP